MAHCTRGGDDMRRQRQAEARLQGLAGKDTTSALVAAKDRRTVAEVLAGFDDNTIVRGFVVTAGVNAVGEVAPAEDDVTTVTFYTIIVAASCGTDTASVDGNACGIDAVIT